MKTPTPIRKYLTAIAPISVLLMASASQAAVYTGATGIWSLGTNWDTGSAPNGVGEIVSRTATGTVTVSQDLASVTVGSISLTGNTNFTINQGANALTLNQDDTGSGYAVLENAGTNAGTMLTLTNSGGALFIGDDLLVKQSNVNSTAIAASSKYGVSINGRLVGTKSITVSNVLNDLSYGMVAFGGGATAAGTYTGAVTLAKGALTWTSNVAFGATSGMTLGSTGGGDVSLVTANTAATFGSGLTVAANTEGKSVIGSVLTSGSQKFTGAIALNQDLTVISQMTQINTTGVTLEGVISGIGGLQINGTVKSSGVNIDTAGIVKISGSNTYTGDTRVYKGTLLLGAASGTKSYALQNSTLNLDATDAGTVGFGWNSSTTITSAVLGGLSGSLDLALQNIATTPAAVALSVGNNNKDTAYSGALTGAGSLIKIGTGALTLNGQNTYTGATSVNAGSLVIGTQGALASSSVNVAAGTTLKVNGSVSGAVIASGTVGGTGVISGPATINGTLAPGNSIGTLSTGSLTLATGSILDVELGRDGASVLGDLTAVTGDVVIQSGVSLKLSYFDGLSQLLAGDVVFLIDNDGSDAIQGTFASLYGDSVSLTEGSQFTWNSQQWLITYSADASTHSFTGGHDVAIQVVPEPATWAMLLGGFGLLAVGQRLRRRG